MANTNKEEWMAGEEENLMEVEYRVKITSREPKLPEGADVDLAGVIAISRAINDWNEDPERIVTLEIVEIDY